MTENSPLADRMRPQTLAEFVGQEHLTGKGKILRSLIESDSLVSLIFWGPPGVGKTTLAKIIANSTNSYFYHHSAVSSGIADIKIVVLEAKERLKGYGQRTILFIDEIHRFNKAQQDTFLPYVEDGSIILIGATTENPSFEVISPLLSRCKVLVLNALTNQHLKAIIQRALRDKEKGLGEKSVSIETPALEFLIDSSNGDARIALNALELGVNLKGEVKGRVNLKLSDVETALQKEHLLYDRAGEEHYNIISAFIKSMRGSDPDAALYYLARMIEAGEDPLFIARRMVIFASEDIGNADPHALMVATSCLQAVNFVGLPEGQINLAQAVTYLSSAPKSNASYMGLLGALGDVKSTLNEPIPMHLRNAPTKLMKKVGYGKNYKYPHEFKNHFVKEGYLPKKLAGRKYYKPTEMGYEIKIKERMEKLKR